MLPTPRPGNSNCSAMPIAPACMRASCATSVVELDVLVENDAAVVVAHDVVAVQAVAVRVEVVSAFGAGEALGGEDRLADRLGVEALCGVDRAREDGHR